MRQQRLGVVDAFDLDRQRQLVLIRRDNVEHLVMIGGPNDVLLEAAIIRQPAVNAASSRTEPAAPPLPSASPAVVALQRSGANGLESEPDFEPQARPSRGAGQAAPPAPGPAAPRLPFPARIIPPASPLTQRPLPQPTARDSGPLAVPPPGRPNPATEMRPAAAPPVVSEVAAPPVAPPTVRPALGRNETPPRPPRPFPTLRPGGGPLFPVRSTANPPTSGGAAAPTQETGGSAPSADAGAPNANASPAPTQIDSFESLEEEMAKLLGRPGPGQS